MRRVPRTKNWDETLREFRSKAEALPEGPERLELEQKVMRLEHAIAFRASVGQTASQASA